MSEDTVERFRRLHESGCFVMPNPWDVGSALALADLGFPALATTSAGFAWSIGRTDTQAPLDDVLDHLRAITAAVDVPVNADFENGYATEPDDVARNVGLAVRTGIAGLSIEDSSPGGPMSPYSIGISRSPGSRPLVQRSTPAARGSC